MVFNHRNLTAELYSLWNYLGLFHMLSSGTQGVVHALRLIPYPNHNSCSSH